MRVSLTNGLGVLFINADGNEDEEKIKEERKYYLFAAFK